MDHTLRHRAWMIGLAGWLSAGLALAGEPGRQPLQPLSLAGVARSPDGAYQLTRTEAVTNRQGWIVFEAETHGCYPNEGYRRDAELAGGAGVEDLTGVYSVRIGRAGLYDFQARVKAPWPGTWTFTLSMQNAADTSGAPPEPGLPAGFTTTVDEGPGTSLNAALVVAKEQAGKAVIIRGGQLKLEAGRYILHLTVPSKIVTDQILLTPVGITDPERALKSADGQPLPPSLAPAETGEVLFEPVFPLDLKAYERLEAETAGPTGNLQWFYRLPDGEREAWVAIAADGDLSGLSLRGDGCDALQVKLVLRSGARDPAPAVARAPVVRYTRDPARVLDLRTASARFRVSRVSGYWGAICKTAGDVPIRADGRASLPFHVSVLRDGAAALADRRDFHATRVDYRGKRNAWSCRTVYETRAGDLRVELTGVWGGGEAVTWRARIENRSSDTIEAFHFPVLNDVQIGTNHADDAIAWLGHLREPMTGLQGWLRSMSGALTYFDLYDHQAAFYVGVHDASMLDGQFHLRPYGLTPPFNYRVEKRPTILPGAAWESGDYVLAVHDGDWHEAADAFYRPWYDRAMPKPDNPRWLVEDFSGWAQPIRFQPDPARLTEAWRICRFYGWNYLKSFTTEWPGPDFYPPLGGFPAVQRNAQWIRARGGHVDSYTDCAVCCLYHNDDFGLRMHHSASLYRDLQAPSLDWLLAHQIAPLAARNRPATAKAAHDRALWPRQPLMDYKLDNADTATYPYWEAIARHYAAAGMHIYWDEAGNAFSLESSYKPLEGQVRPGHNWALYGRTECARRMIRAAREINPDFVLVGENYNDRVMSAVHLPYLQDANGVPLWSEVIRYTHPEHLFTVNIIRTPELVNQAFLMHARICASDIFNGPGFSFWMRARVQLREMTKDVANAGRYRDQVGLQVTGEGADARYVLLSRGGRQLAAINTHNPGGVKDGWLALDDAVLPGAATAFVYTFEGRVRSAPVAREGAAARVALPTEPLATVLLCAREEPAHALRAFALMPGLEPYPPKIRVALANAGARPLAGSIRVGAAGPLRFEAPRQDFSLAPGEARTVDLPFADRGRLDDFIDVPVEVHAGGRARMLRVNVAPTLPNGGFEGDAADNRQADFWLKGLRDFAEPAEGRFCLALPPEGGGEAGAKCPYYAAENTAFLLPRTRYRLELVYRYAGKSQLYAKVIFFDERNKLLGEKLLALPPRWPFAWQEAALAFESPDYAGKAYFRLVNPDRADKGLTGWIDRVRLVESAQP